MSVIIEWLFPKRCYGCGKRGKYLCGKCRGYEGGLDRKRGYEGIISILKYDGAVRKLIESVKYEFVTEAISEMASLMVRKLKEDYPHILKYWQKEKYVILPVPLFWQREKWRGFNQSQKLAEEIAKRIKLEVNNEVLKRKANSGIQAKIKNRQLRRKNVADVFEIKNTEKIPRNVIVLDDVMTSGSTLLAIQKVLKMSPDHCWGLTRARAQK